MLDKVFRLAHFNGGLPSFPERRHVRAILLGSARLIWLTRRLPRMK